MDLSRRIMKLEHLILSESIRCKDITILCNESFFDRLITDSSVRACYLYQTDLTTYQVGSMVYAGILFKSVNNMGGGGRKVYSVIINGVVKPEYLEDASDLFKDSSAIGAVKEEIRLLTQRLKELENNFE